MASYFYAYASQAGARQSRPDWFMQDDEGEWHVKSPRQLVSQTGVWLVNPQGGFVDGEWIVSNPGEMSSPYVILSPDEDGPAGKLINPAGAQGFA